LNLLDYALTSIVVSWPGVFQYFYDKSWILSERNGFFGCVGFLSPVGVVVKLVAAPLMLAGAVCLCWSLGRRNIAGFFALSNVLFFALVCLNTLSVLITGLARTP
jgi:hypothetical protein